ncbi:MAG TPA: family 78 glycoside hydrolase catalytic domain [Puia sp.]|nr:family 78 glycoside hydrolase catalytic domain [Puia sp.]
MHRFFALLAGLLLWLPVQMNGQNLSIDPSLLGKGWPASWISCPGIGGRDYGVFHFRRTFRLDRQPTAFVVHVSADNRYRLWVNGHPVCSGPARGDLGHWNFETIDIAPFLRAGENTLAAMVWNMGVYAPVAQISNRTAFVIQGDRKAEQVVNSDRKWKVIQDSAYQPCSTDNGERLRTYMVIGPGDSVDGDRYPWGWEQPSYDDQRWLFASEIGSPSPWGSGSDNWWTLVPRAIPLMDEHLQRIPLVRRITGSARADEARDMLAGRGPLRIPAHAKTTLLLDQTYNTVAYPELAVSGGKGSTIRLTYAESLVDKDGQKGNRGEIEGKSIRGNYDIFTADGGRGRTFRPLWVRTYRYLQVDISTGDDSLWVDDLSGMYTGYPLERKASFASNDPSLQAIWDVGWRTARLCAGETYFDCPYYEQLQYEADTRIQSLISLYVAGDDRLMRKALLDFYHSRIPEGLTQGRYPSNRYQVIPPFALWWIVMIHDYWLLRRDDPFVRQFLPAARGVLDWFEGHVDTTIGMLGPMPWWGFVDWADAFEGGSPPGASDGHSAVISLQYAYTLNQAAELFDYFGGQYGYTAQRCRKLAGSINKGVYRACFDQAKREMANTPEKTSYSQHAGILAILSDAIPAGDRKAVMEKILSDGKLEPATFYFRFYLLQAMKAAGMGDRYYSQLGPWREMLKIGLTTFAEKPEPTRSDCHAWSASPDYDFLATICGIMPDAPGFARVLIRPALGELTEVEGSMPHPKGMISVKLKRTSAGMSGEVELPEGVAGRFIYGGKEIPLHGGKTMIGNGPGGRTGAVRVIFDTDMGPDYDDVGAIALLHALADSGKAKILATIASNKYEGVAAVLDLFNTWFHRPDIPIGIPAGNAVSQRDSQHWTDSILARYPHSVTRNDEAEDAVTLYRRTLAGQPDHSVVIITVGFLTNLAGLLQSGPDIWSPLNGPDLVRKKVKQLVSMAGKFPEGWEFNVMKDSSASQWVFGNWPTPILLSGFEIGVRIKCGLPLIHDPSIVRDPVKDVFSISVPLAAEDSAGRSSWDETAVLVGVCGYAPFYTVTRGKMVVNANGSDRWVEDGNGIQAHLIEARPVGAVQAVIDRLMAHQPGRVR